MCDFVYSCHQDLLNSLLQRPFQRILLSSSFDNKSSDCSSSEDATVLAELMFKSINNVFTTPVENGNVDGEYSDVLQVSPISLLVLVLKFLVLILKNCKNGQLKNFQFNNVISIRCKNINNSFIYYVIFYVSVLLR